MAPEHPGVSGIEGAFPVSPMHDFLTPQSLGCPVFYVFLVVWVTCPVHRSLRLLPLLPSLSPNIALWLREIGDSNPHPTPPLLNTHTFCDLPSHIVSFSWVSLPPRPCSVFPLPSWQGSRKRPISIRSPFSSLLPSQPSMGPRPTSASSLVSS